MNKFTWIWLAASLLVIFGTPAVYVGLVLPYANSINEPDGMAVVGGFFIGILLIPLGFLSLLTLFVWIIRERQNRGNAILSLKPRSGESNLAVGFNPRNR